MALDEAEGSNGGAQMERSSWLALLAIALVWLLAERLLARYGALALPRSITQHLVLQSYLAIVQILSLVAGLGACFLILRTPRVDLGLSLPRITAAVSMLLWAPVAYVLSSKLALEIAKPTLLEELARGGRRLVEQHTGEFGRSITEAEALLVVIWGVLLAPLAEELVFRGALWTAVQRIIDRFRKTDAPASLPSDFITDSPLLRGFRRLGGWLSGGLLTTIVTASLFAALHLSGMEGGARIMRVSFAFFVGIAAGMARHATGTVLAPIALHVLINLMGVANARSWLVTESLGNKDTVPIVLWYGALVCIMAIGGWAATRFVLDHRRPRTSPSSNVDANP